MTIAEFARLCRCSTQTLRYYDRIDLLKPAQVDGWTGYRHYEKKQAVDFVKIKNLQLADFTIEEIKQLLKKDDQAVYEAFSRKIALQEEKLERIKQIQQSYLREKTSMETLVQGISDFLVRQICNLEELKEFGLQPEDGKTIVELIRTHLEEALMKPLLGSDVVKLRVNGDLYEGADQVLERIQALTEEDLEAELLLSGETEEPEETNAEPVWQADGWQHVHEFIDRIPALEDGVKYDFRFELADAERVTVSFPLLMLGAMLFKQGRAKTLRGCCVNDSKDGQNHFVLMKVL